MDVREGEIRWNTLTTNLDSPFTPGLARHTRLEHNSISHLHSFISTIIIPWPQNLQKLSFIYFCDCTNLCINQRDSRAELRGCNTQSVHVAVLTLYDSEALRNSDPVTMAVLYIQISWKLHLITALPCNITFAFKSGSDFIRVWSLMVLKRCVCSFTAS